MRDSIIKNTGNSRYLKSAISAATTWEQFRAALIAGTLPIDLNGINTAGWQQVGDALNKANLLSDATVAALNAFLTSALPANPKVTDALKSLATVGLGKIAYGSYIGTGTYGASNPCRLTFSFLPKFVVVSRGREASTSKSVIGIFVRADHGMKITQSTNYASAFLYATWADTSLSWSDEGGESNQLNETGIPYHYLAIG